MSESTFERRTSITGSRVTDHEPTRLHVLNNLSIFPFRLNLVMRDIKPILLLLLSVGLVATWTYHLYDKTQYSQRRTEVLVKDSAAVADAIRDSLTRIFSHTIKKLDQELSVSNSDLSSAQLKADSLQRTLAVRMKDIGRLREEINQILGKGRQASSGEIATARQKIEELQGQVQLLELQRNEMQGEQERLMQTLEQLTLNAGSLEQSIRQLSEENTALQQKIQLASLFVAHDIRLSAVTNRNSKETNSARKASRLVVEFAVQNKVQDFSNAELVIVIIQPDNQVLQNPDWNSSGMETSNGFRKYTRIVKFDYSCNEEKQLNFSLDVAEFQKGAYQLELWHKGHMIGRGETVLR